VKNLKKPKSGTDLSRANYPERGDHGNGLYKAHGQTPGGDQVVIYIPSITQFAWVGLTVEGNIVVALACDVEKVVSDRDCWLVECFPDGNPGQPGPILDVLAYSRQSI
jgi:hypothetical protein